eukprot:scaffold16690_cov95-Isochrysis_galbana.AAC.2
MRPSVVLRWRYHFSKRVCLPPRARLESPRPFSRHQVSKTMADQRTPHVDSSLFLGDETGEWRMAGSVVRFLGPAGPFTFYLRCVCAHAHLY